MKTILLSVLLVQASMISWASGEKEDINSARGAKLKQVAAALVATDTDALHAALSSQPQTMTTNEASALLGTIAQAWGDLSKLQEVAEDKDQPVLDKGDMRVVARWGSTPTHFGKWMLFRTVNRPNTYLRVSLLFAKGDSQVGQFVACECKAPEQATPNKSSEATPKPVAPQ